MSVPSDETAEPPALDTGGLQRRYDKAYEVLQTHLLVGSQYKNDTKDHVHAAIEARKLAASAFENAPEDEISSMLDALDKALSHLPKIKSSVQQEQSDTLDRYVAWFNGDLAATKPPEMTSPATTANEPKHKKKPAPTKDKAPNLKAPQRAEEQGDTRPKRRRWKMVALILLAFAISGVRLPERRTDLANSLATDSLFQSRSLDNVQAWFHEARWLETSALLVGFVVIDTRSIVRAASNTVSAFVGPSEDPIEEIQVETAARLEAERIAADIKLQEEERIASELERQAKQSQITPAQQRELTEVSEALRIETDRVALLVKRIEEMKDVIRDQDAALASANVQINDLGQVLNTTVAKLAFAERAQSTEESRVIALMAEREILLRRIADLETANSELAKVQPPSPTHFVDRSRINARQGPGTAFEVVTSLTQNTPLILVETTGGWGKFRLLDTQTTEEFVWISLSLLKAVP
ncbi:MAG: SH3 domain-containing protein [Paracoccaceae bacterium]